MPLAWVDEVAGLEPAINFLQGNGYTSQLWPQQGVDKQFLAYLPLQGWLHIISQTFLDFSVYLVRLPYAIYLLIGGYFLYKTLLSKDIKLLTALIVVVLVLNEKSLFETTRGVRIEPITFMLLSIAMYCKVRKNLVGVVSAASLLILVHPNVWAAAGILLVSAFYDKNDAEHKKLWRFIKPNVLWLVPIALLIFFLLFIHFDVDLLFAQFTNQAERHTSFGGLGTHFYNHFVRRFWPYYFTQPYIPLLVYFALGYAIYCIVKRRSTPASYALLLTHLVWFAILGPMHRYNSVLVSISLFTVLPLISRVHLSKQSLIYTLLTILVLGVSCIDVASRQVMALVQHEERKPEPFISWLNQNIPGESSIISGHEIAYYASVPNDDLDFFLFNTTPYRFDFDQYKNLYLISTAPQPDHQIISKYSVPISTQWSWIKNSGTKTYQGLYLLRANSVDSYNTALKKMKKKNTAERSKFRYQ